MSWTKPADIQDSWIGEGKPTDDDLLEIWIDRVERLIKSKVPGIADRVTSNEPDLLDTIKDVVCSAVTRVFRNPDGIRQAQTTTGPFTESVTYGGNQPGSLQLLDDEIDRLLPIKVSGAFTIQTIPTSSPFFR